MRDPGIRNLALISWSMFSVRPSSTTRTTARLRPPLNREIICVSHTFLYFLFGRVHREDIDGAGRFIHGISSPPRFAYREFKEVFVGHPPGEPQQRNNQVKSTSLPIPDPQQRQADVAADIGANPLKSADCCVATANLASCQYGSCTQTEGDRQSDRLQRSRRYRASSARPISKRHTTHAHTRPLLRVTPNGLTASAPAPAAEEPPSPSKIAVCCALVCLNHHSMGSLGRNRPQHDSKIANLHHGRTSVLLLGLQIGMMSPSRFGSVTTTPTASGRTLGGGSMRGRQAGVDTLSRFM
jgi:hypothetical protein